MSKGLPVSIGVFAHNEESNINRVIESILNQKTEVAKIKEVLVISSGSHDRTNALVRKLVKKDKRIKFLEQFKRQGKSSAINLFLQMSTSKIVIVVSSDLRLHSDTVEEMTLPFLHPDVGMVGGHPIPCNSQHSRIGREVKLLWQLHHLVSLHHPKCGEIVAFRNVIRSIPKESAVDEANIEVLLKLIGYKIVYAPRAIVYNKVPRTIGDFLTQRRRVYAGHRWVSQKYNYQVSTMDMHNNFQAVFDYFVANPSELLPLSKLIALEFYGRFLGWVDFFVLGKNPYVWKMVKR
jgi:poly-beta-1,6-N-acetyl-D-glucosamine synthase